MTTAEAAESGTVEDTTAAAQAAVSSQDDDKDYEAEAREMGWVPEEEFKGDRRPKVFKSAKEFVDDIPPYVRKMLEKAEAKFSERVSKIEKVNARTVEALTKQHKQEITDLTAARKKAVADGDAEEVARISDELADKKANAPEEASKDDKEAEEDFVTRNPWYGEDGVLTMAANAISQRLAKAHFDKTGEQLSYEENLKQTEAKIKASPEYKAKFPTNKTTANGHAAVDGGSENPGGGNKSSPLAKLSAEERAKAKDDMKKFPKVYPDEAAWLKAYNS